MIELHLKIAGALLIVLGLAHSTFGRRFGWKEELARLSLLNRQMFRVHCFFIALTLVLMGSITLFYTKALLQPTALSRVILVGVVIFWVCRLFIQFLIYESSLWRGNAFNTWMHVLFSCFWIYLVVTYSVAARMVWR
jgi:hypothetical protein